MIAFTTGPIVNSWSTDIGNTKNPEKQASEPNMLKLAANLSFLFPSVPFTERFALAAQAGFSGVEYLFPYDYAPNTIKQLLQNASLRQVLFNVSPGNWNAGERGLAALPGRETQFADAIETALRYAEITDCTRVHIMAGLAKADDPQAFDTFVSNLAHAAERLGQNGITALIEPINPIDMPGYYLTELNQALEVIKTVAAPNLKLQFDCYHRTMMGQDVIAGLEQASKVLGHIQIAGMPGRHEPGSGTLNYDPIFEKLVEMQYAGWIGCEYHPAGSTTVGLAWRETQKPGIRFG